MLISEIFYSIQGEGQLTGVWREGDFIIQDPGGHIFVVEAKGGPCALDAAKKLPATAIPFPASQLPTARKNVRK